MNGIGSKPCVRLGAFKLSTGGTGTGRDEEGVVEDLNLEGPASMVKIPVEALPGEIWIEGVARGDEGEPN